MKASKIHLLLLLTFAFAANAAQVDISTARLAAGTWALSDASLGVPHGTTVSDVTSYDVDGTNGFYAVALEGGGTLFLAADDEIGPVIAFTASSDPDLSQGSYLRTMLERDVAARRGILSMSTASKPKLLASSGTAVSSSASVVTPAKKIWSALVPSPIRVNAKLMMASATPRDTDAISDMRVEPLVKSQWNQSDAGGGRCYNYYTPDHDPCGCTATAASQIMRYYSYPDHELSQIERPCTVNGILTNMTSVGDSRIYDWENMKLMPKSGATETEREAIGRLTYDVGVAVYSSYTSTGTGADPQCLGELYQDAFDYASGVMYWNETGWNTGKGGLHTREMRNKIIYANLDAGRPVQLAIYFDGHSVVCDGYGFVKIDGVETEFAHINMGWGGTDDMWYNIPEINAANSGAYAGQSGMLFQYMGGAQFNIHPTETGDLLTGRITDDGEPVVGAEVTVYSSGSSEPIAVKTTDVHGIYSFALPGNATYDVRAVSPDGIKGGSAEGLYLPATVEDLAGEFVHNVTQEMRVGNSWGNDIDIVVPHVRIVGEGEYQNLDDAFNVATNMTDPIIEIFGPVRLKDAVTITTNMTIRTVPGPSADYSDPTLDDCAVTIMSDAVVAEGWAIQIADGVRVDFSNIVFHAESGALPVLDVLETGTAAFAGTNCVGTVVTRTADAFVLAGAFEPVGAGLSVSYAGATTRFLQFGVYECPDEDAEACARLIFNALNPRFAGKVGNGGTLIWDQVPIDPSIAIVYATNDTIGITHYMSVDVLFEDYTNGAEVVFLKDCLAGMFTNSVVVTNSVTMRSEADTPVVVTLGKDVGFAVQGEAAELVFTNVVFTRGGNGTTNNFVTLDGGSLVLDDGAVIAGLHLGGAASAVYVNKGSVTMRDGSAITNCVATYQHQGKGSAVYLKNGNCSMDFCGGTITGCRAGYSTGAAVYAEKDAVVDVSGSATARGNYCDKSGSKTNDVKVTSASFLVLAGSLTGSVGVTCSGGTDVGESFATVGDGVSDDAAKMACGHFFNDKKPKLVAAVSSDGKTLVWANEQTGPQPVPKEDAVARLVLPKASDTYASIDDALEVAGGADARIELLKNTSLVKSLSIKGSVVLDGMGNTLTREGNFYLAVTNSTLTLTNIVMDGGVLLHGLGRILDVYGGSLTLEAGTRIYDVCGDDQSMVAPIVVQGGSFVMESGATIYGCSNSFDEVEPSGPLTAGAVLINGQGANAEFRGGTIKDCKAGVMRYWCKTNSQDAITSDLVVVTNYSRAGVGGVYVGNQANVRIGGDTKILGNKLLTGEASNLVVQDQSGLVLSDLLTGRVGYTEGVSADTNVFGTVDAKFAASTTPSNLVVSARRFRHDRTDAKGMVAKNTTETILVWSTAVGDSTKFTNSVNGVVYDVVLVEVDDDDPEIVVCEPFAFAAIEEVSPGKWKLTLRPGTEYCVYTLKSSSDLETWTKVGDPKKLSSDDISGEELEFIFEVDDSDGKKFWKVEGANGTK